MRVWPGQHLTLMNSSCYSRVASKGISIDLRLRPSQPRLPASPETLHKATLRGRARQTLWEHQVTFI